MGAGAGGAIPFRRKGKQKKKKKSAMECLQELQNQGGARGKGGADGKHRQKEKAEQRKQQVAQEVAQEAKRKRHAADQNAERLKMMMERKNRTAKVGFGSVRRGAGSGGGWGGR